MKKKQPILKILVSIFSLCLIVMLVNEVDLKSRVQLKQNSDIAPSKYMISEKDILAISERNVTKQANNINENKMEISDEQISEITHQFMEKLVQETDENNKVKNFTSKEELINAFEDIATKDVASHYIDDYYYEQDNELYIIPTETPPWFLEEQPYEKTHTSNNIVEVTQHNTLELYGNYSITIEFFYNNKTWQISNVIYDTGDNREVL